MAREPVKGVRYETLCAVADLKSIDCGKSDGDMPHGGLEGYLAVFGNIDSDGEVFDKGAFAKSASERVNGHDGVPLMIKHFIDGGDVLDAVGTIFSAKEDDHGLFIRARYASTPDAQLVRTKVVEKIVKGLSIGFQALDWKFQPEEGNENLVLHFTEAKINEGTITLRPSNTEAQITAAKAERTRLDDIDKRIARVEAQIEKLAGKDTAKAGGTDDESAAPTPAAVIPLEDLISRNRRELDIRGVR